MILYFYFYVLIYRIVLLCSTVLFAFWKAIWIKPKLLN